MAVSQLSLGGNKLLFDQDQQAANFLWRYQPLQEQLAFVADSIHRQDGRQDPRGQSNIGLPSPNYPSPPPPKLNQLYWPTGAARWARGYFLCAKETRDALVDDMTTAKELVAVTDMGEIAALVFALSPRPATAMPDTGERLWIVPVVDQRYWWQFKHAGNIDQKDITSWSGIFGTLSSQLGAGFASPTIDAAYLQPDDDEFSRRYRNPAQMLDAAAMSVGCRVVCQLDGTVLVMDWETSENELGDNLTARTPWYRIAGDEFPTGPVPQQVLVSYPKCINGMVQRVAKVYTVTEDAEDHADLDKLQPIQGMVKTVHSTCWADFDDEQEADPNNKTGLEAMTAKIASHYYASLKKSYDYTFQGIKDWYLTGYDDHILYQLGCEYEHPDVRPITTVTIRTDRSADADTKLELTYPRGWQTRIQSCPPNLGVEEMLHQVDDVGADDPLQLAQPEIFRPLGLAIVIGRSPADGIPARDGNTPGVATCELYYVRDSGDLAPYITPLGSTETAPIHNLSRYPTYGDVWIIAVQTLLSGQLFVVWEDC